MADPGIVRNRLKVEATIDNARALLKLAQRTRLSAFLWGFLDGRPQINRHKSFKTVPAETPLSKAISKALKAEGFRFVGPTTIYAFMQSTGMVNDHLVACHRHEACAELQRRFKAPVERGLAHDRARATRAPIRPARTPRAWQRMLSGRRLDLLDPAPEGHRDRGHRPRARPRRALERADGGRARLLGRPARAAGGGDRHRHAAGPRAPLAARRAAARCARIRDRRPHQPVQGRHRPRLQGLREPAAGSHLPPLRPAAVAARPHHHGDQGGRPHRRLLRGDAARGLHRDGGQPLLRRAARRAGLAARAPAGRSIPRRSRPPRPSSWRASRSCRRSSRPALYFGT